MAAQIVAGTAILPTTRASSIAKWNDKDAIAIQVINNCSNNNVVSNVQSKITLHDDWQELIRMFESQDVVIKMFLKDNLQILEMKDGEIVMKHFQSFRSLLEQLSIARTPATDGCDHNQMSQKTCWVIEKNCNFVTNIYVLPL
jgi:hypothetical protein